MALDLAERHGGIVVNADSMQVYSVLDVLTARPGAADLQRAPHELYGHVHPSVNHSTGAWLRDIGRLAEAGTFSSRRPIFVGGTGLYFRALVDGLSDMPDIPADIRARLRGRLAAEGPASLHDVLLREDPAAASAIRPGDGQRIVRALEVLEASGRSIRVWQGERARPLVDRATARFFVLEPPRAVLRQRIVSRLALMAVGGAVEEVRRLLSLGLDPSLPAMKAIGVREFGMVVDGRISLAEGERLAAIATSQYAKRQSTWFRHQLGPQWERIETASSL